MRGVLPADPARRRAAGLRSRTHAARHGCLGLFVPAGIGARLVRIRLGRRPRVAATPGIARRAGSAQRANPAGPLTVRDEGRSKQLESFREKSPRPTIPTVRTGGTCVERTQAPLAAVSACRLRT